MPNALKRLTEKLPGSSCSTCHKPCPVRPKRCQAQTILTAIGIAFAEQPRNRNTACSRPMRFDMICAANGIEHRLNKPNHPCRREAVKP